MVGNPWDFIFEFWILNRWIGMKEMWDGQSVGANIIGEMEYIIFFCPWIFANGFL
jgi:hypothetical protein